MAHKHRTALTLYARRRWSALIGTLAAAVCGLLVPHQGASPAAAEPPTPPSAAEATTMLGELSEKAEGSMDGYTARSSRTGSTRATTATPAKPSSSGTARASRPAATATRPSGTWKSPYDGETWTKPSDVDIDHIVPLAEAWRSGASDWTQDERQELANDLSIAQLIAVTDNVNQSKGDKDPAKWMPPRPATTAPTRACGSG